MTLSTKSTTKQPKMKQKATKDNIETHHMFDHLPFLITSTLSQPPSYLSTSTLLIITSISLKTGSPKPHQKNTSTHFLALVGALAGGCLNLQENRILHAKKKIVIQGLLGGFEKALSHTHTAMMAVSGMKINLFRGGEAPFNLFSHRPGRLGTSTRALLALGVQGLRRSS